MNGYRLINKTNIPTEKIHRFIKFSCPKGLTKFSISILKAKSEVALDAISFLNNNKIKVWIGPAIYPYFSHSYKLKKNGYTPIFLLKNEDEALLSVLSHELRHLWQINVSNKNFTNGRVCEFVDWSNQKCFTLYKMESDACRYAKKMLNKYRKINNKL